MCLCHIENDKYETAAITNPRRSRSAARRKALSGVLWSIEFQGNARTSRCQSRLLRDLLRGLRRVAVSVAIAIPVSIATAGVVSADDDNAKRFRRRRLKNSVDFFRHSGAHGSLTADEDH